MPESNGAVAIKRGLETRQLRPAPLVSISQSENRNKSAKLNSTYTITLNGYLIASTTSGDLSPSQSRLKSLLDQQNVLRNYLNSNETLVLELSPGGNSKVISATINLQSIDFEEGVYVDYTRYTIVFTSNDLGGNTSNILGYNNVDTSKISEFSDTWSFEVDESYGRVDSNNNLIPRSYIATRNISAVGVDPSGFTSGVTPSWQHAYNFVNGIAKDYLDTGVIASSIMGFSNSYNGYNHSRVSNIDKAAGSVSITDTWYVLYGSGEKALENYNISVSTSADNPYVKVNIEGTIKGLTPSYGSNSLASSGFVSGDLYKRPYINAQTYFNSISNSGNFGTSSKIYQRVNNAVSETLNSQPLTVSLGQNDIAGEINYNLEFDNRPTNYFTDAIYESISVNDTYPGDVFATIPVLGRPTGPILQYTFGRTEFRRDLSVEILLDNTDIGYGLSTGGRSKLLLPKPSLSGTSRSALNNLITEISPAREPGIRKYFLSPPQESWNPKEGRYTLNISWTYELDK